MTFRSDEFGKALEENNAEYLKLKEEFDEYIKAAGRKEDMFMNELVKVNAQLRQERGLTQKLQDERVTYASPSPQYARPHVGWMPMHGWTDRGYGVV